MGRLFKVLGVIIGVALLLVVAAIVILPMAVDPNDFKGEIVGKVQEQTGRDLKISGDLNLSVFPWLGVKVDGVELSNAQGFGNTPFVSVKHAAVRVKLMPLLKKRLEVDTIELDGVALNLVRKGNGAGNWDDLGKAKKGKTTAGTKETQDGPDLEGFSIGGIDIKDARISWDDGQTGQRYEISNFNLKSGAILPGKPVGLSMGMLLQSREPALNARIGLDGTIELNQADQQVNVRGLRVTLDAEGAALPQGRLKAELESNLLLALNGHAFALLDLKVRSGSLNITGDLKGANLHTETPSFGGTISIAEFNPRDWMASQGMAPPAMADAKALTRFAAQLDLSAKGISTNINNLLIQLDDTRVNGNAIVQGGAAAFKLDVDKIDLDRYLPVASGQGGTTDGANSGTGTASGKEQLLPLDLMRGLDMSGSVNIGSMTVKEMVAEKVQLTLKARNGVLESAQKIGAFFQGSYQGTVDINASGKTPALKLTSRLSGVQLEPLVKKLAGEDRLSGEGNFNADLTASGNDVDSLKRTLNGKMDFNLLKGAIKGINLAAELRKAKALLSGKSAPAEKGPVQTDFSQIKGSAEIKNGLLSNKDLQALSPFFRVSGSGQVDLVKERLDYTAIVFVVETSKGQGGHDLAGLEELERKKVGVPVHFTGPLASPKWEVQWKDVLLDEQKEKLKSKLEEKLIGDEKTKEGEEESDKDKLKKKLLKKLIH